MTALASARTRLRGRLRPADGPPRWLSGLAAGVQAGVLSALVVVVPALVAYVVTSADPANADVGWLQAVGVAAAVWLLGHGGALRADDVLVTFAPLGVAALALLSCHVSARRSAHPTRAAWGAGTAGYVAVVALAVVMTGGVGPVGAGPAGVLGVLLGAGVLAGVGTGLGTRRLVPDVAALVARAPVPVRLGLGGAGVATGTLVAAGVGVTGWWLLAGRAAAADVVVGLGLDAVGGGVLALAQLLVLPNLVLWAVAWLAGPGFAIGAGTLWSPTEVVSAPLPALPLLGALPPAGGYGWAPAVVVAAGAVAGWYVRRGLRRAGPVAVRAWHGLAASAVGGVVAGTAVALLQSAAAGAAGPGRMSQVGAHAALVGLWVAAQVVLGAVVVAVPTDPAVRAAGARLLRAAGARLGLGSAARASGAGTGSAPVSDPGGSPAP